VVNLAFVRRRRLVDEVAGGMARGLRTMTAGTPFRCL